MPVCELEQAFLCRVWPVPFCFNDFSLQVFFSLYGFEVVGRPGDFTKRNIFRMTKEIVRSITAFDDVLGQE